MYKIHTVKSRAETRVTIQKFFGGVTKQEMSLNKMFLYSENQKICISMYYVLQKGIQKGVQKGI